VRGFRLVHLTGPNQSRETARRLVMDVLGVQLESFSPDFYKRSGERERERGGFSSQSDAFRPLPLHGCGALPLSTMTHSSTSPPSSSAEDHSRGLTATCATKSKCVIRREGEKKRERKGQGNDRIPQNH